MKKLFSKTRYLLALVSLVLLGTNGVQAEETITIKWFDSSSNTFSAAGVASNPNVLTISDAVNSSDITMNSVKSFYKDSNDDNRYWTLLTCATSAGKNTTSVDDYVTFKVTVNEGYKFTPTKASAFAVGDGTGDNAAKLYEGTASKAESAIASNSGTSASATAMSVVPTAKTYEAGESFIVTLYVGARTKMTVAVCDVVITGTYVSTSAPAIEAVNAEIKAIESGVAVTKDIDITGSNLTGSTLTAELSPAVEGLSVKLDNSTITSGSISAKATITYTATENTDGGQTTLILSDGTTTKEVTITYSAKVKPYELQTISEATTWDFSKGISGGVQFTTDEDKAKENVYADIEGLTFTSEFNAKALAFKGEYPLRSGKTYAQNGTLHFKTSVQGTIAVKFSDTGSSFSKDDDGNPLPAAKRYLNINGKNTEYYTQRDGSKSDEKTVTIFVPTGDILICGKAEDGETDQAICVSSIVFTPVTSTDITIANGTGYRTFASKYPTDWSSVEDVTAYTAKVNGNEVTFEKVTGIVPAGEGLLLKGKDNTYTIPTAKTATTAIDNALVGVTTKTEVEGAGIFVLYDGDEGVGFYKTTAETFTVGANTAYIPANVVSTARTFIALDGETTGVNAVESVEATDGKFFNLQGRQVSKPTKGLYISNGKKYIVK